MLLRFGLAAALALTLVVWTIPVRTALAPIARAAELPPSILDVYVRVPRNLPSGTPAQVLVALHGMGGTGPQFAQGLVEAADRNHWLLVAPTIDYGDWTDPRVVAREEPRLIRFLSSYLDHIEDYVGLRVKPRILLLGHSRGAQLAHRFALFEPQRVRAVAALSAGTYTLPTDRTAQGVPIAFPFGLSDMAGIAGHTFSATRLIEDTQFWLGVGTEDNNPADLPRAWDQYLGTTRVQRARAFQAALHTLGAQSVLVVFPGEAHGLSQDMSATACIFLRTLDLVQWEPLQTAGSPEPARVGGVRGHF